MTNKISHDFKFFLTIIFHKSAKNCITRAAMSTFNSLLVENANNSVSKVIQALALPYQKRHPYFGHSGKGSNCFLQC